MASIFSTESNLANFGPAVAHLANHVSTLIRGANGAASYSEVSESAMYISRAFGIPIAMTTTTYRNQSVALLESLQYNVQFIALSNLLVWAARRPEVNKLGPAATPGPESIMNFVVGSPLFAGFIKDAMALINYTPSESLAPTPKFESMDVIPDVELVVNNCGPSDEILLPSVNYRLKESATAYGVRAWISLLAKNGEVPNVNPRGQQVTDGTYSLSSQGLWLSFSGVVDIVSPSTSGTITLKYGANESKVSFADFQTTSASLENISYDAAVGSNVTIVVAGLGANVVFINYDFSLVPDGKVSFDLARRVGALPDEYSMALCRVARFAAILDSTADSAYSDKTTALGKVYNAPVDCRAITGMSTAAYKSFWNKVAASYQTWPLLLAARKSA